MWEKPFDATKGVVSFHRKQNTSSIRPLPAVAFHWELPLIQRMFFLNTDFLLLFLHSSKNETIHWSFLSLCLCIIFLTIMCFWPTSFTPAIPIPIVFDFSVLVPYLLYISPVRCALFLWNILSVHAGYKSCGWCVL